MKSNSLRGVSMYLGYNRKINFVYLATLRKKNGYVK